MTTLVSNPKTLFITNPIPETPPAAISHGKKKNRRWVHEGSQSAGNEKGRHVPGDRKTGLPG